MHHRGLCEECIRCSINATGFAGSGLKGDTTHLSGVMGEKRQRKHEKPQSRKVGNGSFWKFSKFLEVFRIFWMVP